MPTQTATAARPATKTMLGDCYKCGGSGKIRAFAHIEGGRCFTCKGKGMIAVEVAADLQREHWAACRAAGVPRDLAYLDMDEI